MIETMLYDALAEQTRRDVLRLLAQNGPMHAKELADGLQVSPQAMSRHLKLLLQAGLVSDERVKDDARLRFFRLEPDAIAAAQAYLDQLQMAWRTNLKAFKQHAEKPRRRTS